MLDVIKHVSGLIISCKLGPIVIIGVCAKSGTKYVKQRNEEFLLHLSQLLQQFRHIPILLLGDFNMCLIIRGIQHL